MKFLAARANVGNLPPMKPEEVAHSGRRALEYKPKSWKSSCTAPGARYCANNAWSTGRSFMTAVQKRLSEERMIERAMALANAKGASRGDKILIFASRLPESAKNRSGHRPPRRHSRRYQRSLQRLENGIQTMSRDRASLTSRRRVGTEQVQKYDLKFADEVLAEARCRSRDLQPLGNQQSGETSYAK